MRSIIAFVVSSLLYSHAYLYLYNKELINILPGITLLLVVLLGCFSYLIYLLRSKKVNIDNSFTYKQSKNRRTMLFWFAIYCSSLVLLYAFSDPNEYTDRAFKTFIILSAVFLSFFLTFNTTSTIKAGIAGIIFILILSVLINYFDFIVSDVTVFSESAGRAAGFYVNPNIAGLSLLLGMILSVKFLPEQLRLVFCLFIGSAVVLTFSRSSAIAWLISFLLFSYFKIFKPNRIITITVSVFFIVVVALMQTGEISLGKNTSSNLSADANQRLVYSSSDRSVKARLKAAERAIQLFERSPIYGHGLGSSQAPATQTGPHNQYLIIAAEQGTIGVMLYLLLFLVIWKSRSNIAIVFILSLAIASFFDHNILDFPSRWLAIYFVIHIINNNSGGVGKVFKKGDG